ADVATVADLLVTLPGTDKIFSGPERANIGLDHPRAGDIVVLSKPNAWFAYPFWLDDRAAPAFARTVDIHRKPGDDPGELFFDPQLRWPKVRAARRLLQKKLGFRALFDVVPLDPTLVKGSHGRAVSAAEDRPVFIGDGPAPDSPLSQMAIRDLLLREF